MARNLVILNFFDDISSVRINGSWEAALAEIRDRGASQYDQSLVISNDIRTGLPAFTYVNLPECGWAE